MLVFLATAAFGPPRTGAGGSRRQLSGGSRGSGAGAAGCLQSREQVEWERSPSAAAEEPQGECSVLASAEP